jgi:hypothetical protein
LKRQPNHRSSTRPNGPEGTNAISNSQPVTTGGNTSGRFTATSASHFHRDCQRAKPYPINTANGKLAATAHDPTRKLSRTACHSSEVRNPMRSLAWLRSRRGSDQKPMPLEHFRRRGRQ